MPTQPTRPWLRLLWMLSPLAVTPLLGWLIAEGWLNFGGGEKDLVLLIPWLIWSVCLLLIGAICWRRWQGFGPWAGRSLAWSFGISLLGWITLLGVLGG